MPTSIGVKIKKLRESKNYTLDKLAELTKSSKSYIWELENREDQPRPSADKLSAIAEKLGVTMDYLLDDENNLTKESAEDAHFYRSYQKFDEQTKSKIRKMVNLWKEDDE